MTPPPAQQLDAHSLKVIRRPSLSTFAVALSIYAAWGIASAVVILVLGRSLAAPVARLLLLNQADASALVVTALALIAGLSAPAAVSRLRAAPTRLQARKGERDSSDLRNL